MDSFILRKLTTPSIAETVRLKQLWQECFDEDKRAVEMIFNKYIDVFGTYCASCDGKIVAALYLVNGRLNGNKAHYLCGAATQKEYRGRGIMTALIEYALNKAHENGDRYSLLFPASEELYKFYSRLGYLPKCTAKRLEITRSQLERVHICGKLCNSKVDFEHMQKTCFKENFMLWDSRFLSFAADYYGVYGVRLLKGESCVALVCENSNTADVIYSVYADFGELKKLLLKNTDADKFIFTAMSDDEIFKSAKPEKFGMIKPLESDLKIPENIYIGISLM